MGLLSLDMLSQVQTQSGTKLDTMSVKVYFRQSSSELDPGFRENGMRMMEFVRQVDEMKRDSQRKILQVNIVSGASPEGSTDLNWKLSKSRAEQISDYMRSTLHFTYPLVDVRPKGIDWGSLEKLISESYIPDRDEVLFIIRFVPEWISRGGKVVDGRKHQLQMLNGGRTWQYIYDNMFPELRYSAVQIISRVPVDLQPADICTDTVASNDIKEKHDTVYVLEQRRERKPFYLSARNNFLYDAALVPNIGAEVYLGGGWSLEGTWAYAWWKDDGKHDYWRIYGGELDVRRWFGRAAEAKPLTGHHLGLYGQIFTYDFELGDTGNLSKFSYGWGFEYGYALPIGRRLNLDFSLGIGYIGGDYKKYEPVDECYVWRADKSRHWFGPTKAEITLAWLIGRGNVNKKK